MKRNGIRTIWCATIAVALSVLSYVAFASPAATQDWVKDYVASNTTSSSSTYIAPTTVTVYNDDGEAETVTFNWVRNTNDAFRVTSSACTGVTNGLTFARTGDMRYYNATNYACPLITGAVECVRILYTSAVDRVVGSVTNTVYTGTNYVYDIVYHTTVGSTPFSSVKIADGFYCFRPDVTNSPYGFFYLTRCKISDITRQKIITLPTVRIQRRPSLLELFFPSAYADWGEWVGTGDTWRVYDEEGISYEEYEETIRHYYTDADAETFSLGTVEWDDANGNHVVYTIDYTFPFSIAAGQELCDARKNGLLVEADISEEEFKSALEGVLPRNHYLWITRSTAAWNTICNAAQDKIDTYNDKVAFYASKTCPEHGSRIIGTSAKECIGHVWRGTCGSWTCIVCQAAISTPSKHDYTSERALGHCDVCKNTPNADDREAVCNNAPRDISAHRGWFDAGAYSNNCECYCGYYALPHKDPNGSITNDTWALSYAEDAGDCYRLWKCERCGECNCSDTTLFATTLGCTATKCEHSPSGGAKYYSENADGTVAEVASNGCFCAEHFTCDHKQDTEPKLCAKGCDYKTKKVYYHTPDKELGKLPTQIADNYSQHMELVPCSHGFDGWDEANTNWCGWTTNMLHDHSWSGDRVVAKVSSVCMDAYKPNAENHFSYRICGDWATGETNAEHQCLMVDVVTNAHTWGSNEYGNPQESVHDISNRCTGCNYYRKTSTEHHTTNSTVYTYLNNLDHSVTNYCKDCVDGLESQYPNGYPFDIVNEELHVEGYDERGLILAYGNGNPSYHYVSNKCAKCKHWYCESLKAEMHGNQSWIDKRIDDFYLYVAPTSSSVLVGHHSWSNRCNRCGVEYLTGSETCNALGTWTLNGNTNGYDACTCSLCGGNNHYEHKWTPLPISPANGHYCANGVGHLSYYPHEWEDPSTSNRCVVCGYEPEPTPESNVCKLSCGCTSETCKWGLMDNGDGTYTCSCPECLAGNGESCACHKTVTVLCLNGYFHVITRRFKDAYIGSEYVTVDFDDPVYQIDESGFEGAFSNSLALATVKANALTNAGDRAFYCAFRGCTNINSISFQNLEEVGNYAFYDAFGPTNRMTALSFPSLTTAGNYAFEYAFTDSSYQIGLKSVSFPKLVNIGTGCFNEAFTYYSYDSCPIEEFNFASVTNTDKLPWMRELPNLKKVILSKVQTVDTYLFGSSTGDITIEELWLDQTPTPVEGYFFYDGGSSQFAAPWYTCVFVPSSQLSAYKAKASWSLNKDRIYSAPQSASYAFTATATQSTNGCIITGCITSRCSQVVSSSDVRLDLYDNTGTKITAAGSIDTTITDIGHKWWKFDYSFNYTNSWRFGSGGTGYVVPVIGDYSCDGITIDANDYITANLTKSESIIFEITGTVSCSAPALESESYFYTKVENGAFSFLDGEVAETSAGIYQIDMHHPSSGHRFKIGYSTSPSAYEDVVVWENEWHTIEVE